MKITMRPCGKLSPEQQRVAEEALEALLRGELTNYSFEWRQQSGPYEYRGFMAAARSELEALQYTSLLGPGWQVKPAGVPVGHGGCFRPLGIMPAIDLYDENGERWVAPPKTVQQAGLFDAAAEERPGQLNLF